MGSKGKVSRINWDEIGREYIQGLTQEGGDPLSPFYPTLKELSELHGISLSAIEKRCERGGWVAKRDAYQKELSAKVGKMAQENFLEEAKEFWEATAANAIKVNKKIGADLDRPPEESVDAAATNGEVLQVVKAKRRGTTVRDYKHLTEAILNSQTIVEKAMDKLGIERQSGIDRLQEFLQKARDAAAKEEQAQAKPEVPELEGDNPGDEPNPEGGDTDTACPYL